MRICILVPSEGYVHQAGARIRYNRIEDTLLELGHELRLIPIQNFAGREHFAHDVYIISKCYTTHSLVVARLLANSRKLIGIDLFDDYFTQLQESDLTRFRLWLRSLLSSVDFALCSTPAFRSLVGDYAPGLPAHVMNDPSGEVDEGRIGAVVEKKLEYIHKTGVLNVGWFGIGDNPDFPVGLSDLVAFAGELGRLNRRGFEIRLDILTNRRAMTADGLAMLRRLPIPYTVDEWTEERETALLAKSLVCFLPVNAQNFSTAKSLNRGVSALTAGAQVFSVGYPLYAPLSPLVYRDPAKLLSDIRAGVPALRKETVQELVKLLELWASPSGEAKRLAEFLDARRRSKSASPRTATRGPLAAVIYGKEMEGDIHDFAQRMGVLSISSPFCTKQLNFDIRFAFGTDESETEVYVSERCSAMLSPNIQALLMPHGDGTHQKLMLSQSLPTFLLAGTSLPRIDSPMTFAASYDTVIAGITKLVESMFPGIAIISGTR